MEETNLSSRILWSIFKQNVQQLSVEENSKQDYMYYLGASTEIMRIILKYYYGYLLGKEERKNILELAPIAQAYAKGTDLDSMLRELRGGKK